MNSTYIPTSFGEMQKHTDTILERLKAHGVDRKHDKRAKVVFGYIERNIKVEDITTEAQRLMDAYNKLRPQLCFAGYPPTVMNAATAIVAHPEGTFEQQHDWLHKWGYKLGVQKITISIGVCDRMEVDYEW